MFKLIILLLHTVVVQPALATDLILLAGYQFDGRFKIGATVGETSEVFEQISDSEDELHVASGAALSLAVDFALQHNQNQRIGLFFSHRQTRFDNAAGLADRDLDISHFHFTAMSYYPRGSFEPFVLAGLGVARFAPGDTGLAEETRLSAQIGGGANYRLHDNLLLRLDLRWLPTFFNGDGSVFCKESCTVDLRANSYNQIQLNTGLMFRF